jgi:catechol 2,3-dioxygenase-like lactoylglutathione lyase family enzyme
MRSLGKGIVVMFAIIGVVATVQQLRGQSAAPLQDGTFTHVGIVVKDIAKASQLFADVYGVTPPAMPRLYNSDGAGIPFPPGVAGNRNAKAKLVQFTAGNVRIELIEPDGGPTAWSEHLEKFGQGVHHLAFGVPNIDQTIRGLQAKGGKWVMGAGGQTFAYVDMKDELGFTIEVGRQPQAQPPAAPAR